MLPCPGAPLPPPLLLLPFTLPLARPLMAAAPLPLPLLPLLPLLAAGECHVSLVWKYSTNRSSNLSCCSSSLPLSLQRSWGAAFQYALRFQLIMATPTRCLRKMQEDAARQHNSKRHS